MSKETEQNLQAQLYASEEKTREILAALKVVQEWNERQDNERLPLVFMAKCGFTPRLCIRVTKELKQTVYNGAEYITLTENGLIGNQGQYANTEYIRGCYEIGETIFEDVGSMQDG